MLHMVLLHSIQCSCPLQYPRKEQETQSILLVASKSTNTTAAHTRLGSDNADKQVKKKMWHTILYLSFLDPFPSRADHTVRGCPSCSETCKWNKEMLSRDKLEAEQIIANFFLRNADTKPQTEHWHTSLGFFISKLSFCCGLWNFFKCTKALLLADGKFLSETNNQSVNTLKL